MEFSNPTRGQATAMPPFASAGAGGLRRCVAAHLPALFFAGTALCLVLTASPAWAGGTTLYAYAGGGATSPTSCPETTTTSEQCTLGEALSLATAGGTIALATPRSTGHYVGNWTVSTPGTSSSAPLTVKPALRVTNPTLDGNYGNNGGSCSTPAGCDGAVLTIGSGVHLDLDRVTIENANNTSTLYGGAIDNDGTLSVSATTFSGNSAGDGGAIANADNGGNGTLTVSASTFSGNTSTDEGGAIDNAGWGGKGSLTVSASTFFGNSASSDDGGAIDNADYGGNGTVAVLASTFSGNNSAADGGAIASADNSARSSGTVAVSASTFSGNTAGFGGGAIDNGDGGKGSLTVSTSTFSDNSAGNGGGAIANSLSNTLIVSASTFSGNTASTFPGNTGPSGGAINNAYDGSGGTVWAAADIFNGPCDNAAGTWNDEGYNVGSNGTCLKGATGDVSHGAERLRPLAHNGGPTKTMLPLEANPAIGVIPYKTTAVLNGHPVTLCPTIDQRGVHSASGQHCNAGAVQ